MAGARFDDLKTIAVTRHAIHTVVSLARPRKSNSLDDAMWSEIPKVQAARGQQLTINSAPSCTVTA